VFQKTNSFGTVKSHSKMLWKLTVWNLVSGGFRVIVNSGTFLVTI